MLHGTFVVLDHAKHGLEVEQVGLFQALAGDYFSFRLFMLPGQEMPHYICK